MELSLSGTVPIETIGQLGFICLLGWHYGESSQQWRTLKVLWNVLGVTAEDRGPGDMQQLPFQYIKQEGAWKSEKYCKSRAQQLDHRVMYHIVVVFTLNHQSSPAL